MVKLTSKVENIGYVKTIKRIANIIGIIDASAW